MFLAAEFLAEPAAVWPSTFDRDIADPSHLKQLGTTRLGRIRQLSKPIFKRSLVPNASVSPTVNVIAVILCPLETLVRKTFASVVTSN